MEHPLSNTAGAVVLEGRSVAAHYGSPLSEQRELARGEALVDLSDFEVVTVSGADRLSWLDSFTSQRITGRRPGESVETLLLDPNGRIEHAIRLVDDGERSWLILDPGSAAPLTEFLLRMRFAMRVEVTDVSSEYAVLFRHGEGRAEDALRAAGPPVVSWCDPWRALQAGGVQYATEAHPAGEWRAVYAVVPRSALLELAEIARLGDLRLAGTMALRALEIAAWRPSFSEDVDARALPHEFDWLRSAVHMNKGCYRGQETVAKVHNLGHPPRRLVLLHLDGSEGTLPEDGALVFRSGESAADGARPVGRVTRAALHHEWGPIALALLKRAVPEDAPLDVVAEVESGSIPANPEVIVPASAGAARDIPRLKRI